MQRVRLDLDVVHVGLNSWERVLPDEVRDQRNSLVIRRHLRLEVAQVVAQIPCSCHALNLPRQLAWCCQQLCDALCLFTGPINRSLGRHVARDGPSIGHAL